MHIANVFCCMVIGTEIIRYSFMGMNNYVTVRKKAEMLYNYKAKAILGLSFPMFIW